MGVGLQVGLPDPVQQFPEGRIAGGVGAQHQRVDEEADQVVQGAVGAAGDRGAQRHVRSGAELAQPDRDGGLQHHEEAGAGFPCQRGQAGVDVGVQGEGDHVTAVGGACRARPVHRQGQFLRQARQGPAPEVQLAGDHAGRVVLAAQYLPLPQGVVRVLHRQFVPGRRLAAAPCRVGGRQVTRQRTHGPPVGGDVVQHEQQHVLPLAGPEQRRPQRQVGREVETACRGRAERRPQVLLVDLDEVQPGHRPVQDDLDRTAVDLPEDGAQHLVAADHVVQGRGQRGRVEHTGEPHRDRQVVRGGLRAVQPAEEPQPLLRVREGQVLGARYAGQGPAGRSGVAEQPGEPRRGGRLEQGPDGQFDVDLATDPADQTGAQQGVAAQLEEAVVGPGRGVESEDLPEQAAQQGLLRRGRSTAGLPGLHLGRGQGLAVELAVGGERQGVEGDEGRRHHVLGQRGRQVPAQCAAVRVRGGGVGGDGVGDESLVAGPVLADQDGRLGDVRVGHQHRLDLAELDPEAAQLDLVVGAAQVLQGSVGAPADQVAGAVHAAARVPVGAGGEPLRGQRRAAQVAAGQLLAGEVELSHHARGDRAQRRVQHVHPGVPHGVADRDGACLLGGLAGPVGDVDGRLGRAVEVVQLGVEQVEEAGALVAGEGLTAADHPAEGGPAPGRGRLGEEGLEHGRHEVQRGDPFGADQFGQVDRVPVALGTGQDQRGAGDQRPEELPHRHVEAGRRLLEDPVVGAQAVPVLHPQQPVDDAAVRHGHALGAAGGAGGVDDVRRVVGAGGVRQR